MKILVRKELSEFKKTTGHKETSNILAFVNGKWILSGTVEDQCGRMRITRQKTSALATVQRRNPRHSPDSDTTQPGCSDDMTLARRLCASDYGSGDDNDNSAGSSDETVGTAGVHSAYTY